MAGNRYSQNYGSNDNGNNSNDYDDNEDRANLTLSRNTAVNGVLDSLGDYSHPEYGKSLIVDVNDVTVLDGIVMEKEDKDETYKVFSWDEFGFKRDEDGVPQVEEEDIPRRHKINVAGNSHVYKTVGHAAEGRDDLDDEFWLDDVTMWMNVSSKSRTLAKILSVLGEAAVPDDGRWTDDYEWLRDGAGELRSELEGKEVELFFKEISYETEDDNGDKVSRSYDQAVVMDVETEQAIVPKEESPTEVSEPSVEAADVEDLGLPEEAEPVLEFYTQNADEGAPPRQDVRSMLSSQLPETEDPDEYVDTIIDEVKAV
jgi:hypothetical protein